MVGHSFFSSVLISTAMVAASLLLFSGAGAEHKAGPSYRGEAFTDPNKKFPMPEDWVKKPVKYEPWAGKADIAIALEQDVYQTILPLIKKYPKEKGLKIEVKEGTCGIAAGMLSRKTVDRSLKADGVDLFPSDPGDHPSGPVVGLGLLP